MKKLILLALTFVMYGCGETTITNHRETKVDCIQDGFPITIIDSCEYIRYATGQGPEFTHNGKTVCLQGNAELITESEYKELIHRLKED